MKFFFVVLFSFFCTQAFAEQKCEKPELDQMMIYMDMKEARAQLAEEVAKAKQEIAISAIIARSSVKSEGQYWVDVSKNTINQATNEAVKTVNKASKQAVKQSEKALEAVSKRLVEAQISIGNFLKR
jgi:hypothetical protein